MAAQIKSSFTAVWTGQMDSDGLNQLTLRSGLPWRAVVMLRAYGRYLLQTGLPFSQGYIAQVLVQNSEDSARLLAQLFASRFDPAIAPARRAAQHCSGWTRNSRGHSRTSRLRRGPACCVPSGMRFRRRCAPTPIGGIRRGSRRNISPSRSKATSCANCPCRSRMFEIFVFSPRMEGVHLRMGKVARGGIRWSDRREDFRTEILGLMKAQNVKNTLIVPVGAKGGFVLKRAPLADREAQQAEVVACYRTLIRGLLDLTDNIVDDKPVAPPMVVCHDPSDPYLVVAADKGTATFSDIANAISEEYALLARRRICLGRLGRL